MKNRTKKIVLLTIILVSMLLASQLQGQQFFNQPTTFKRDGQKIAYGPYMGHLFPATPGSPQAEALRETQEMARRRIHTHVGRRIGDFEGSGAGSTGTEVPTCIPYDSENYILIADAITTGSDGRDYRVRAWERIRGHGSGASPGVRSYRSGRSNVMAAGRRGLLRRRLFRR